MEAWITLRDSWEIENLFLNSRKQIEQKNIDEAHQAGVWNTNRKLGKMGKHRVYNFINNF